MLLKELQSQESISRRVIVFAKDGNTVIRPYKRLIPLTGIKTNSKLYADFYSDEYGMYFNLYNELNENTIVESGRRIHFAAEMTVNDLQECIDKYTYFGKEGFIKRINSFMTDGIYVNLCDIETLKGLLEYDLLEKVIKYRAQYIEKRERKEELERKLRHDEEKRQEEEDRRQLEKQVECCIEAIKNKKEYRNGKLITGENTVILYVMKEKGIKIPLKTQGWINKALAKIWFDENGKIAYSYYSKCNNSNVFYKYLEKFYNTI